MKNTILVTWALGVLLISCQQKRNETVREQPDPVERINTKVLNGWNTWNNPSVLSHVHMPDGLNLQFMYRKKRGGPYWLNEAYVASPKYNFPEKIKPLEHALDGSYTALELEWEGASAKVESATDGSDILLLYTPLSEQEKVHVLVAKTEFLWNKPGTLQKQDSIIKAVTPTTEKIIRVIGSRTNTPESVGSPYFSFDSDSQVAFYTGKPRTLEEIRNVIASQKKALKTYNAQYGELADSFEAIQSVVGWNMFYDAFNDRGIASVSRIWNQTWGGYIIFDWDTYFIALLASLDHKELAYANVFAITNSITDGGFIPNVAATYEKSNDRSQPPVGSMTAKLIYDRYGEKWFLEEVYDELLTWNRWWADHRDNEGFLSWGSHPHPKGMSEHTLEAAKWESGLDNSPMFDGVIFNEDKNMMDLASVGLMGLYIADCNYLAEIARTLEKEGNAKELAERAKTYTDKLNELWDEDLGIYRDKNLVTGSFTEHKSPTHFYPLLAGVPSPEQAERMVREHLLNPDEFYGDYMIPSISRDNAAFGDNSYWRGRIWAPMNFLVYMGLCKYDFPEARRELARKSQKLIMHEWTQKRRIHENYNAETGQGDDVRNSDPFYAWAGLLAYIALMEEGHVK